MTHFRQYLLLAAILLFSTISLQAKPHHARYVFYFIGDGMGMGHVNAAETYNRDVKGNQSPLLMFSFPVASQVRTYSANSPITDSAAAGTALSTGSKTNNSMIGMNPDTLNVYSIASKFMKAGWHVGVASTVPGDDATPAAFYAHVTKRSDSNIIGSQAINSGITFLGAPMFRAMKDGNDWELAMQNKGGYTIARGMAEYRNLTAAGRPEKILLLSNNPQGEQAGFTIDSVPGALTLQDLTSACLRQLYDPREKGFFMMVEAGNIDWAAHANDGGAVIKEILNFQNAIDVAYQFYLKHPDETLIVITADHDTGGMALGRYDNSNKPNLALIDYQRISKDAMQEFFSRYFKEHNSNPDMKTVKDFLVERLGIGTSIKLTEQEEKQLDKAYTETFITSTAGEEKTLYNNFNHFTKEVFNILNRHYGIGFTTTSHTGNPVPLFAIGVGATQFSGALNNIDIPKLILKASGLK